MARLTASGRPHVQHMEPRFRRGYFVLSVLLAVAYQAPPLVGPLLPGHTGDVVSSFGAAGLLLLAFMARLRSRAAPRREALQSRDRGPSLSHGDERHHAGVTSLGALTPSGGRATCR